MDSYSVNPVVPGFAPDPSLVYVDGTYFLVNSSFHMFPGLPVYASKDLKKWKHIGNALNSRWMSLQHSRTQIVHTEDGSDVIAAQGGLMAPSIRYHKGTFYIVCTNVQHAPTGKPRPSDYQNFILSTTNIWADEWNDPVFYDFWGIDTSLFWDDDDKAYLIGAACPAPESQIKQFGLDLKTGKKLTEEVLLWEGITKVYPEGPHMYKKDGWYYLLIAEGGCFADHHSIMARSRNIWGPFEPNPANPVLKMSDPNGYIQYTSHGDLFQVPTGEWYFVCLGVRKNNGHFIMGRESVLTTVTWPKNEYPVIDSAQLHVPVPSQQEGLPPWPAIRDPKRPNVAFLHIRDYVEENYEHAANSITITSSKADVSQCEEPVTFVGQRQRRLQGSSSITLPALASTIKKDTTLRTGLCYYKDEHRFIKLFIDASSKEISLEVLNKARSVHRTVARNLPTMESNAGITLGVDYIELELTFWYEVDGQGRTEIEKIDTIEMTGHDFVGPVIGVFAVSDNGVKVECINFSVE